MSSKKKQSKTSSTTTTNKSQTVEDLDYSNPVTCFNVMAAALNNANQRGAFNLAESQSVYQSVNSLAEYINNINTDTEGGGDN